MMTKEIIRTEIDTQTKKLEHREISILLKLSHELKTPIHGIGGISSYLHENWDSLDDDTLRKHILAISDASAGMIKLLDSLLSKTNDHEQITFDFTTLDLIDATKSAVDACKSLYPNKQHINIKLDTNLDKCYSMTDHFV